MIAVNLRRLVTFLNRAKRARYRPLRVAAVLLALTALHAAATSIVVITDGTNIAVSADSLVLDDNVPKFMCKIRHASNCFFAASGSWSPPAGFDVLEIGKNVCASGSDISAKAAEFRAAAYEPLLAFLHQDRRERPVHYRNLQNNCIINAAFFGIEKGRPVIVQAGFEMNDTGAPQFFEQTVPAGFGVSILGQRQAGMPGLFAPYSQTLSLDERSKRFVEAESAAVPGLVGGHITTVLITPQRTQWLCSGECGSVSY